MHLRTFLLAAVLAPAAAAQLSLPILPTGNGYLWGPPPSNCQVFFDMTVNTTVTFQGITYTGYTPAGYSGSIDMWLTNAGTTTYVGNETNAALWSLRATGPTVYPLTPTLPSACFTTPATVQPGTYGVAIRYNGVGPIFYLGNGSNQNFFNTELSVSAGATQYSAFTAAPISPYVFTGTLYYGLGTVAHSCATKTNYGEGCNAVPGSFWQSWTTAAATAAALNGRRLTLTYGGSGYVLSQGVGVSYIPATAAATAIPATSNGEAMVPLPSTLLFPGGSTTTLYVHSNGFVSDSPNQTPPGSLSNLPHPHGLLNTTAAMWALAWHDFNPAETGSGVIKYEQVGNLFIITYENVESWPAPTVNPSLLQIQFDLSNHNVHYVYQTITNIGGSPYYDATLVGFSPPGPSPDIAPTNVTTVTALALPVPEVLPLKLTASAAPIIGTNVDLVTSNEGVSGLGVNFLALTGYPAPGISLAPLGAPGCVALLDIGSAIGNLITNLAPPLPTMTITLPIPAIASLAGIVVVSQSVFLDSAANPLGLKSSNATSLTLGVFGF